MKLSGLGATSMGLWTRPQALEVVSRGTIKRLVAGGYWQVVLRGVYADGGYELSAEQQAFAVLLASGAAGQPLPFGEVLEHGTQATRLLAVACGRTAARVWEFPLIDDNDPSTGGTERFVDDVHTWRRLPHLRLTARPGEPRGREVRRHRLHLIEPLVQLPRGLWLTPPVRTALDCVTLLGHEAGVCVLDDGLHRDLFTTAGLEAAVEARRGWPTLGALAKAVRAADGRAEAPSETLARLLLQLALPGLVPQVRCRDRSGRVIARFDLGDEEIKLAFDMDGKRGHAGTAMVAKDRKRDRTTAPYGWWTERGTWHEVRCEQAELLKRVVARDKAFRDRAA